jgi:hypothetical protein
VQLLQLFARFVENVPTSQVLQFIANPSEKDPASQPSQDVAPLGAPVKEPDSHSMQSSF